MIVHMQAKAPAYVVATNKDTKEFLLSVRGTSQMDDVITDMVAVPDEFDGTGEQAHSGMVQGAEWLFDRFLPLAQVLHPAFQPLHMCGSAGCRVHDDAACSPGVGCDGTLRLSSPCAVATLTSP